VLVPGCHGGMLDQNTIRVLTSFCIVSLTFNICFIQITSDSSKGATVMIVCAIALSTIIKTILFLLVVLLTSFQVTGDNPEEAIVKVAEGNILNET
jgi:NADH:ubiquinone oxidoreductase subunit K